MVRTDWVASSTFWNGTNLGDYRLFPINLSIDEKELEDIGLQFCSLLGFILGF